VGVKTYLVSTSGQMSLPAEARHRWQLDEGGKVSVVDLGDVVVIAPGGDGLAALIDRALPRAEHLEFVHQLDADDDLATT
jgi:hypothetical protein